ncbi:unannotated protein [freshwater metagenome]|uniref:Unannotated protein n=1 Tax=freshwater metagenome TaxID=449393 RepID=A0A6J6XLT3_9ZZZZ
MSSEDHEVSPREFVAVFLLDRPQQSTGLVEVGIVWPAVQRRKALRPLSRAAASVANAVGACAVPCHADEKRSVVSVVSWPPVLRGGHDLFDVLADSVQVQGQKRGGVVEIRSEWIGAGWVLLEDLQVELIWPPISICSAAR